jgi:hypothetical protein
MPEGSCFHRAKRSEAVCSRPAATPRSLTRAGEPRRIAMSPSPNARTDEIRNHSCFCSTLTAQTLTPHAPSSARAADNSFWLTTATTISANSADAFTTAKWVGNEDHGQYEGLVSLAVWETTVVRPRRGNHGREAGVAGFSYFLKQKEKGKNIGPCPCVIGRRPQHGSDQQFQQIPLSCRPELTVLPLSPGHTGWPLLSRIRLEFAIQGCLAGYPALAADITSARSAFRNGIATLVLHLPYHFGKCGESKCGAGGPRSPPPTKLGIVE